MTFEEIKNQLERKKIESAKAEVRLQQISDRLKEIVGSDDIEAAKKYLGELEVDLESSKEAYNKSLAEAEQEIKDLER